METSKQQTASNAKSPLRGDLEGLQSFEYYLKEEGLKHSTISEHLKNTERFIQWTKENELTAIAQINYNELLGYVQHLKRYTSERNKPLSMQTVNIRINSIRKYYEHLKEEGTIEKNPAKRLFIKGTVRTVVKDVLNYTELENLYQQYLQYLEKKTVREKKKQEQTNLRSKVILGLMIWQAVHSGELKKMEVQHINLQNGTVYIPAMARSKSRELKLATVQIIPLHAYLNALPPTQTKLLECSAHSQVTRITSELKGINGIIRNGQHIRASVIFHWLKMYDKRQVQYMIGHKWISSTENYEVQELDGGFTGKVSSF